MTKPQIIQTDLNTVLTEQEKSLIDAEIAHVPYKKGVAVDALKIVQDQRGWVSDDCLQAIARYLDMSAEEMEGIATFYNLIYRKPVGEKVILLCDSVSCWICGGDSVKEKITTKLGITYGETTPDNRYTLIPVPCLGACDRAPVMMVGDDLVTHIDDDAIKQLVGGQGTQDTGGDQRKTGDHS